MNESVQNWNEVNCLSIFPKLQSHIYPACIPDQFIIQLEDLESQKPVRW